MKRSILFVCIIACALMTGYGCAQKPQAPAPKKAESAAAGTAQTKDVVASFKSGTIGVDEFKERVDALPNEYKQLVAANKKDFLEDLILEKLLYKEALREGIDTDQDVQKLIEESKKKIIISKLIEEKAKGLDVTDEEKQAYYEANKEKFRIPERIKISHILINDKATADQLLKRINDGESFEDLARQYSQDPSKQRGGDIGFVAKGDLIPKFEEAAFALEKGQTSDVVQTDLGYHIIRVTDKQDERILSYKEMQTNIGKEILDQKRKEVIGKYVDGLKGQENIQFFEDKLSEVDLGIPGVNNQMPAAASEKVEEMAVQTITPGEQAADEKTEEK